MSEPTIGHNSAIADEPATKFAKDQLRSIVERIERLETDKAELASDIRDVYAEAKGNGYDVPALRAIVKMRKEDANKRRARNDLGNLYGSARHVG